MDIHISSLALQPAPSQSNALKRLPATDNKDNDSSNQYHRPVSESYQQPQVNTALTQKASLPSVRRELNLDIQVIDSKVAKALNTYYSVASEYQIIPNQPVKSIDFFV